MLYLVTATLPDGRGFFADNCTMIQAFAAMRYARNNLGATRFSIHFMY